MHLDLLKELKKGPDQIYSLANSTMNSDQAEEVLLRESVASKKYDDYLEEIAKHHSIPVMDKEVQIFLNKIPLNGNIIDVGGCWGWHWRHINTLRKDIKVFIVDFVKGNLNHALNLLDKDLINKQIFLIHGDATELPFENNSFAGYWTVQTLQHIPNFKNAILESYRVLEHDGIFANYSLNNQFLLKLIYKALGKNYHTKGKIDKAFYLERFSEEQVRIIEAIYERQGRKRYSEILFKPSIKFSYPGRQNMLGTLDSLLSNFSAGKSVARQMSYHITK